MVFQASFKDETGSGRLALNIESYKLLYLFSCVTLCLIIIFPSFYMAFSIPAQEKFSEILLLGSTSMINNYPYNVSQGSSYSIYLILGNNMGSLQYYAIKMKFRNQSEPLPDRATGEPSPLPTLIEYRAFLKNGETWQRQVSFSFPKVSFENNVSTVESVSIDGHRIFVNENSAFNSTSSVFYYQFFFELWIYNSLSSSFQFDGRYVAVKLNMTAP